MKGQISYEFFIALIIFIIFAAYIVFRLINITPTYTQAIDEERLKSEAYQLSELLINDPGEPAGWTSVSSATRLGFLDQTKKDYNILSTQKMSALGTTYCNTPSNYQQVLNKLDVKGYNILFKVTNPSGAELLKCGPQQAGTRLGKYNITRVVSDGTNPLVFTLEVV